MCAAERRAAQPREIARSAAVEEHLAVARRGIRRRNGGRRWSCRSQTRRRARASRRARARTRRRRPRARRRPAQKARRAHGEVLTRSRTSSSGRSVTRRRAGASRCSADAVLGPDHSSGGIGGAAAASCGERGSGSRSGSRRQARCRRGHAAGDRGEHALAARLGRGIEASSPSRVGMQRSGEELVTGASSTTRPAYITSDPVAQSRRRRPGRA